MQALTATDIAELIEVDVLEPLDLSRLKNAPNIIKTFSIADSPLLLAAHLQRQGRPLQPEADQGRAEGHGPLWDPRNQGKVGIVDIQHVYTTMAAALVGGGKTGDFDKAKKALLDLKKLKPRIYPSNEALAQALQTEEVGLCIMWKARAVQWQNAGINILTVAPKEGLISYVSGFAIPKNAPNKAGAYAFLDAALEPSAQEGFAVDMGYNPVVRNAKVAPDLKVRIGFTPEEEKLLVNPDLEFLAKRDGGAEGLLGQGVQGGLTLGPRRRHDGVGRRRHSGVARRARRARRAAVDRRHADRAGHDLRDGRPAHPDRHPVPLQPQPVRSRQDDGRGADRSRTTSCSSPTRTTSPRSIARCGSR